MSGGWPARPKNAEVVRAGGRARRGRLHGRVFCPEGLALTAGGPQTPTSNNPSQLQRPAGASTERLSLIPRRQGRGSGKSPRAGIGLRSNSSVQVELQHHQRDEGGTEHARETSDQRPRCRVVKNHHAATRVRRRSMFKPRGLVRTDGAKFPSRAIVGVIRGEER
jgi:hypothetical protein